MDSHIENEEHSVESVAEIPMEKKNEEKIPPSWTLEENQKYAWFLKRNQDMFKCERRRRVCKVFKLLSQSILSKTMKQCKSHHQKMLKRFGCNNRIIVQFLGANTMKEVKIQQDPCPKVCQQEQKKIESKLSILQLTLQQTKHGSSMLYQEDLFQVLTLNPIPRFSSYSDFDFI